MSATTTISDPMLLHRLREAAERRLSLADHRIAEWRVRQAQIAAAYDAAPWWRRVFMSDGLTTDYLGAMWEEVSLFAPHRRAKEMVALLRVGTPVTLDANDLAYLEAA